MKQIRRNNSKSEGKTVCFPLPNSRKKMGYPMKHPRYLASAEVQTSALTATTGAGGTQTTGTRERASS